MTRIVLIMTVVLTGLGAGEWGTAAPDAAAHPSVSTAAGPSGQSKPSSRARTRQSIYPDQIRAAIYAYLQGELKGNVQEIQVTLGEPRQPIAVPAGQVSLRVSTSDADRSMGRRVFQIHVSIDGRFHLTVDAVSEVAAYVDMVMPVRLIKTDETLEADDVAITRVPVTDMRTPFAMELRDVIGKAAARPLPPQMPIRLTSLRRPYVVRKGDRVMIEAKLGGLSVQTVGVTKSNGELGQTIVVSNTDSGKDVRATVIGPGVVRVDF